MQHNCFQHVDNNKMHLLWQLAPVKNHQRILKKVSHKKKKYKNIKKIKQHNFFNMLITRNVCDN